MKTFIALLFLYLFYASISHAQNNDTAFYSLVKTGIVSGKQKIWKSNINEYQYSYYYNDRGRGDSLYSTIKINNEGLIISVITRGVDYYKNPFFENFEITKDSSVWIINEDRNATKFNNQIYNSFSIPGMIELQLKWLLRQPGNEGITLPQGFIQIKNLLTKDFIINEKSKVLKLYAVYYDTIPLPEYYWFTDDEHFFGSLNSWYSLIQTGYEKWIDTLFAIQEMQDSEYYTNQMNNLSSNIAHHLLITHANVFESSTGKVKNDMTVEILDGKIISIFKSVESNSSNADTIIDVNGKFLMPGLWDMHSHYFKSAGAWYIAGGVTHVRDMGNANILLSYKQMISDNRMLGPDISCTSGFIDQQGPFQGPTGKIVSSLEEALEAINDFHNLGYDQIKIYSSISPSWVAAMCDEAHRLDMNVCGHIPAFMNAEDAINSGYNELTHMNFIFLNFMSDTIDTRTPLRFRMVGDNAGKIDLESKEVQDLIALMREKNIPLDPTMNLFAGMFNEFNGDTSGMYKTIIDWMPVYERVNLTIQSAFGSDDKKYVYKSSFDNMLKMLKLLFDNGIKLVAGTDGGNAIALHHELELYVQAGIPANEVLKIATYNAAQVCRIENNSDEIKLGNEADLILIDGNPAENISDIRRVEWVIKNKKFYNPKQLLDKQGWKYYY